MIKALTIRQPWASLIAIGHKRVETRCWPTRHRGPILIHAGMGLDRLPGLSSQVCRRLVEDRGRIVARAILADCIPMTEDWIATLSNEERRLGFYEPGRFAWLLADVVPVIGAPVVRGSLGLWSYHDPLMLPEPSALEA